MRPRPIELAFADIRIGMTEEELVELMAPYYENYTEHSQWRHWSDGRINVFVTVWPKGFRPIGPPPEGPDLVLEKKMTAQEP